MEHIFVKTKNVRFETAKDLYGLFYEDINHAGDGGLYPEMIRNRSFEDSIIPGGCTTDKNKLVYVNRGAWPGAFNHGEGMDEWAAAVQYTEIPGWYSEDATIELTKEDTLNSKRESALIVKYKPFGKIYNIGYAGVYFKEAATYHMVVFLKTKDEFTLTAILENEDAIECGSVSYQVTKEQANGNYIQINLDIKATMTDCKGRIALKADKECQAIYGYTSLLPDDTYMGHGLRKDLVQILKDSNPKFLRFPGGCIVEGMSEETAMRFTNTIGPSWERPSHNLMWHYRTTNGLGFHEYMQLCEDMQIEALYVCNCGMSCQARVSEYFSDEVVNDFLNEALYALEYALGPITSKYGNMRAQAGHPEPFKLKYVEIGNENFGPEYNKRYKLFYDTLSKKYPNIIYISNSHTEKQELPTQIVDEHYYNAPEFFFENYNKFDGYDRKAPEIFIGEYAVNGGNTIASMECALAEAVFLTGMENNQDIVKLSAYAPLFQNSDYTAWRPNLIVFNNHEVYGIPSYHVISLYANNTGDYVVEVTTESKKETPYYKGIPGIMCIKEGLEIKNVKLNGKAIEISKTIYGDWEQIDDTYIMKKSKSKHPFTGKNSTWNEIFEKFIKGHRPPNALKEDEVMWVTYGNKYEEDYIFEADMKFTPDNEVTITNWNYHPETDAGCNEPKDHDWNLFSVKNKKWPIKPNDEKLTSINFDTFNTYKIIANHSGYDCYINDILVESNKHPLHDTMYSTASITDTTVILKVVYIGDEDAEVEINLDCEVTDRALVKYISAAMDEVNSMENKQNVAVNAEYVTTTGNSMIYSFKPHSVNVFEFTKR